MIKSHAFFKRRKKLLNFKSENEITIHLHLFGMIVMFFVLVNICPVNIHAQLDSVHYIPPIYGKYGSNAIYNQEIHLSTPSESNIIVNVYDGAGNPIGTGNMGMSGQYSISKNAPYILKFPTAPSGPLAVNKSQLGTVLGGNGEGLKLVSDDSFYVNVRFNSQDQVASYCTKGRLAMGKEFKWAAAPNRSTYSFSFSILCIMATELPTKVNITDYDSDMLFNLGTNDSGINADTLEYNLNPGESLIISARAQVIGANRTGFIGAKISSTENIVVNTAGMMYAVNNTSARDAGLDQIIPIEHLGIHHIVMQGNGENTEKIIITGTEDATEIEINGSIYGIVDNGAFIEIDANEFSNEKNMYIKSSRPIYVHHNACGNTTESTDGLNFILPLSLLNLEEIEVISAPAVIDTTVYENSHFNILVQNGSILEINGSAPTQSPQDVPGNPYWKTYEIPIDPEENYSVSANGKIAMSINTVGSGLASYYAGMDLRAEACNSDLDDIPDIIDLDDDNDGIPDSIEGDIYLDSDGDGQPNCKDIDSDNDGIPDIIEAQSTSGFISATGNDHDLDGLDDAFDVDCNPCGSTFGVNIVPIDFDGADGIPDYLDPDSDNDGTLDFTEAWDFDFDGIPEFSLLYRDVDCDGYDDFYDNHTNRNNSLSSNDLTPSFFPNSDGMNEPNWRDASITLPVELSRFETHKNGRTVDIEWTCFSEINNDYFFIEKSDDGENWTMLEQVKGQGNSNEITTYLLHDKNPFYGLNYYRLSQVDFDGIERIIGNSQISITLHNNYIIYPNPAVDHIRIKGIDETLNLDQNTIELYDLKGNSIPIESSIHQTILEIRFLNEIPPGSFLLRIDNQKFKIQIIK